MQDALGIRNSYICIAGYVEEGVDVAGIGLL
jgi:hypothetical protein